MDNQPRRRNKVQTPSGEPPIEKAKNGNKPIYDVNQLLELSGGCSLLLSQLAYTGNNFIVLNMAYLFMKPALECDYGDGTFKTCSDV